MLFHTYVSRFEIAHIRPMDLGSSLSGGAVPSASLANYMPAWSCLEFGEYSAIPIANPE